jgi:hypothetical protein
MPSPPPTIFQPLLAGADEADAADEAEAADEAAADAAAAAFCASMSVFNRA